MTSILLAPRWTTPLALVAVAMPVALAGQDVLSTGGNAAATQTSRLVVETHFLTFLAIWKGIRYSIGCRAEPSMSPAFGVLVSTPGRSCPAAITRASVRRLGGDEAALPLRPDKAHIRG